MRIWIASMAAVAAQPLVMAARMSQDLLRSNQPLYGVDLMFLSVAVVAAAVLVLGLPAFLLLRRFGRDSWLYVSYMQKLARDLLKFS
jgi:hypothetical protein